MTLTTVVGSSGSGKTTFLNDVHKSNKCTYIRQYHSMRPYIPVTKIPNFDPTKLPYWDIYVREGTADTIKAGGTLAGEFTAGLSGGQRKILLFELISQRTADQSELLIALDEPFAGVTDDFVPYIVDRLNEMRQKHNIVLVTNDHVETLTRLADNTITVSAVDRTVVKINDRTGVDRQKAIFALSVGDDYSYRTNSGDLMFFVDVEIFSSSSLFGIAAFTTFCYALFLLTFWDSRTELAALVLVAGSIISFFCINPYLLALVDWRHAMLEEAEALVHASSSLNKNLKCTLAVALTVIISLIQYGVLNAVVNGFHEAIFLFAILLDNVSLISPVMFLGIYSTMNHQMVEIFGSLPFLLMIFLSTTFSPGSGVAGVKELRYVWTRFYFWCIVPVVQDQMEGCPTSEAINTFLLVVTSLLGTFLFAVWQVFATLQARSANASNEAMRESYMDDDFRILQVELYGEKMLRRLNHNNSQHSKNEDTTREKTTSVPAAAEPETNPVAEWWSSLWSS